MLLLDRPASEVLSTQLTLAEYLALPEDSRCEIVDGLLRPMTRSGKRNRTVQRRLANRLEERAPRGLLVFEEEIVVFKVDPPSTRIPDVAVCRADAVADPDSNSIPATGVLLVAEVVSPGSETEDRFYKPGDYARNGVAHFWRVELDPDIHVFAYRLEHGVYREVGVFGRGRRIVDPSLPWVNIDVVDLLGPFA
jgi:Uma2 family endonuclease